jgi:hypothetical protein
VSVRQASTAATAVLRTAASRDGDAVVASHPALAHGCSTPLPPADVRDIDALADWHRIPLVGAHATLERLARHSSETRAVARLLHFRHGRQASPRTLHRH